MKPSVAVLNLLEKMERSLGAAATNCCKSRGVEFCSQTQCPFYDACPLTVKTMWIARKNLGSLEGSEDSCGGKEDSEKDQT